MLFEGIYAIKSSSHAGYENPSQFNREYNFFWRLPAKTL